MKQKEFGILYAWRNFGFKLDVERYTTSTILGTTSIFLIYKL